MMLMTSEGPLPISHFEIEPYSLRVMTRVRSPDVVYRYVRGHREYRIDEHADFMVRPLHFQDPVDAFTKAIELRAEAGLCSENDPMDGEDIWDFSFMVRLCFSDILDVANGTTRAIVRNLRLIDLFMEKLRNADSSLDIPDIPELTEGLGTSLGSLSHVLDLCDPESTIHKPWRRYVDPMGNLPQVSPDTPEEMIVVVTGLRQALPPVEILDKGIDEARMWWEQLPFLEKRRRCVEGPLLAPVRKESQMAVRVAALDGKASSEKRVRQSKLMSSVYRVLALMEDVL